MVVTFLLGVRFLYCRLAHYHVKKRLVLAAGELDVRQQH